MIGSHLDIHEFARRMPKAELHVHLEGSIQPSTLLELARRNRVALPVQDEASLREFYRFRSFRHFIETYLLISGCLRTPADYQLIAYQFGANCAQQNIRYAEVTFTIHTNLVNTGLPWQAIVEGMNAGRTQARQEFGVDWRWVFDINRGCPESQLEVLEIALQAQPSGVVALGLGGDEARFPPELFREAFQAARRRGLPRVPHAGETAGPASIWTAIEDLAADRLGHGVRSIEDPRLVDVLVERQIPLEICPTSNLRLGIYPDFTSHPLRRLWDAGVPITIGSDDPPMFNTDLVQEYEVLVDHFGFVMEDLEHISLNALRLSLLPEEEKARLANEFKDEFRKIRSPIDE